MFRTQLCRRLLRNTNVAKSVAPKTPKLTPRIAATGRCKTITRPFTVSKFQLQNNKTHFRDLDQQEEPYAPVFALTEENFNKLTEFSYPVVVLVSVPDGPPQLQELEQRLVKLANENHGYLSIAIINARKNPELAQDLRVQQVPTTLAVVDGKVVNAIVGVATEQSLRKFVEEILRFNYSKESQVLVDKADQFLEENNIPEAAKLYSQILTTKKFKLEPLALAGLAHCALKENNVQTAKELVEQIRKNYEDAVTFPKIKQIISMVDLESTPQSNANVDELVEKIKNNPRDLESRYDLALHYQSLKRYQDTVNELFAIIKVDKEWNNQAAKKTLLQLFDSLGADHEITVKGRKRLNNLWFS